MQKSVDVLIDSGASGNFIDRELAAELIAPNLSAYLTENMNLNLM